jgi:uncharacterized pyridoxamine 5'-phosphate oxidase family protein
MNTPVTRLDQRYSGTDAVATGWLRTREIIEAAELFWVSTVRADGRPHVTPLVAVWVDEAIYFSTGAEEQKFVNLRANPNVVLTTGCNRWDGGIDVVIEGAVTPVSDEALLRRVAAAFAAKWGGDMWQYEVRDGSFHHPAGGGPVMVFSVRPAKVFAHAKGHPFGATTHRFGEPSAGGSGA